MGVHLQDGAQKLARLQQELKRVVTEAAEAQRGLVLLSSKNKVASIPQSIFTGACLLGTCPLLTFNVKHIRLAARLREIAIFKRLKETSAYQRSMLLQSVVVNPQQLVGKVCFFQDQPHSKFLHASVMVVCAVLKVTQMAGLWDLSHIQY